MNDSQRDAIIANIANRVARNPNVQGRRNFVLPSAPSLSTDSRYTGGQPTYTANEGTIQYDWENRCFWVQQCPGSGSAWYRVEEGVPGMTSGSSFLPSSAPAFANMGAAAATNSQVAFTCVYFPQRFRCFGFKLNTRSTGGAVNATTLALKARLYAPYQQTNLMIRPGDAVSETVSYSTSYVASAAGVSTSLDFRFPEPVTGDGGLYYLYTHMEWAIVAGGFPTNTNVESRTLVTGSDSVYRDWFSAPARTLASTAPPDSFTLYQGFDDVGTSNPAINDADAWNFSWFGTAATEFRMRMNWSPVWEPMA